MIHLALQENYIFCFSTLLTELFVFSWFSISLLQFSVFSSFFLHFTFIFLSYLESFEFSCIILIFFDFLSFLWFFDFLEFFWFSWIFLIFWIFFDFLNFLWFFEFFWFSWIFLIFLNFLEFFEFSWIILIFLNYFDFLELFWFFSLGHPPERRVEKKKFAQAKSLQRCETVETNLHALCRFEHGWGSQTAFSYMWGGTKEGH